MKFGAFSEPDVRILDDDDVEKQEIFIGGLPQDVGQDDIHKYFGKFGDIENVRLKMHSMTGRPFFSTRARSRSTMRWNTKITSSR